MSLAKVTLIGNVGRDPETRYTPGGKMITSFSVAVNRKWNDANGNAQESTAWYRVSAFGKLADIMDGLTQQGALVKGRQVFVAGSLEPREYQANDGTTRTGLDISADHIQLLGSRDQQAPRTEEVPF